MAPSLSVVDSFLGKKRALIQSQSMKPIAPISQRTKGARQAKAQYRQIVEKVSFVIFLP